MEVTSVAISVPLTAWRARSWPPLARELDEMLSRCPDDRGRPSPLIEGNKPAVIPDGKCEQISIGDLLGPQQLGVIEKLDVREADIVCPKVMMLGCFRHRQALQNRGNRQRIWIAAACHDARRAVFRNRARRPTVLEISRKPGRGDSVTDIVGIEKRDQDIDVKQCTHSVGVLFAESIDLFVRH